MWDIACPDYDFVIQATFKKWSERLAELDVAADANPWSKKNDTAFFVGKFTGRDWPIDVSSATGGQPHASEPVNNPRYAILCKDGTKTPKTGITYETGLYAGPFRLPDGQYAGNPNMAYGPEYNVVDVDNFKIKRRPPIKMSDHCHYKYLLNPCGRGPQGIRLKELMACGSLTYMHDWTHREAFYHLIEPWKHAVLWASTSDGKCGSTLDATLDWAGLHPEAAEQIAKNGRKLIKERVNASYTMIGSGK